MCREYLTSHIYTHFGYIYHLFVIRSSIGGGPVQIPLYVATKMSPVKGDSPFIPSPEEYAKVALGCIGYEARCFPYWRHSVQWFLASLVPDAALNQWRLRIGIRKRNEMKATLVEEKVIS